MVAMLDLNVEFEWTTTSKSPIQHVSKCALFCAFMLVQSKKPRIKLFHLHHVTVSISTTLLFNTIKVGFVPICGKKKLRSVDEEFQTEVGY